MNTAEKYKKFVNISMVEKVQPVVLKKANGSQVIDAQGETYVDCFWGVAVVMRYSKGIGKENVEALKPSMGAEDFAYYLEKVPGSFFRLGCRNEEKGIIHPYHSSMFEIDEEVLRFGVEMFVRIIDQYLGLKIV